MDESDELKHCAYTNSYYSKSNSLLLSAKVNGKRTKTVEVCLKTFKILQAGGLQNKATKYHHQIVDLVKNNISKIKNAGKTAKKKKQNVALIQK